MNDRQHRLLSFRRDAWVLVLMGVVCLAAFLGTLGPGSMDRIAVLGLVNLVLVVGLYIFVGNSGVLSFGHMAFAAIGAYTSALLTIPPARKRITIEGIPETVAQLETSAVVAIVVGGVLAAAFALLLTPALMRMSGLTAGLATLALLLIVSNVAAAWEPVTGGTRGLSAIPVTAKTGEALAGALLAILLAFVHQRTGSALRLRASREDEVASRAVGVRVPTDRGIAWVLSAFVTGAGGALYSQVIGTLTPTLFYLDLTFLIVAMLVIGGQRSLTGAVVGTLAVTVVAEVLRRAEDGSLLGLVEIPTREGVRNVGLALVMLLILLVRPSGLTRGRELRLRRFRRLRRPASHPTPSGPTPTLVAASPATEPDADPDPGAGATSPLPGATDIDEGARP
jgi:branched-chain amino acid transport system permease protein